MIFFSESLAATCSHVIKFWELRYKQDFYANSKIYLRGTVTSFTFLPVTWNKGVITGALAAILDHEENGQTPEMVNW